MPETGTLYVGKCYVYSTAGGGAGNQITPQDPLDMNSGGGVMSTNRQKSVGLSDCVKTLLRKFFPKLDLGSINLTLGLPSWAPNNTTSGGSVGGLVVGNTIYTSSQSAYESHHGASWEALTFLAHEITHVDQYRRLGTAGFAIGYGIEGLFQAMVAPASRAVEAAYDANAFETRAVANAARIVQQLKRSGASPCPVEAGNLGTVTIN